MAFLDPLIMTPTLSTLYVWCQGEFLLGNFRISEPKIPLLLILFWAVSALVRCTIAGDAKNIAAGPESGRAVYFNLPVVGLHLTVPRPSVPGHWLRRGARQPLRGGVGRATTHLWRGDVCRLGAADFCRAIDVHCDRRQNSFS